MGIAVIVIFFAGAVLLVLGIALMLEGYRPRRIGEAPHCARCDYLVGGLQAPRCPECGADLSGPRAIIKGDRDVKAISAASIIAKTTRDAMLREFDKLYPVYGFAQHKGYGTPDHLAALDRHGPCPLHRRSFAPVVQCELDFE